MNCDSCQSPLEMKTRYEINKRDPLGGLEGTVNVCSVKCLLQFTYRYGAQRVTVGAMMAKYAINQVLAPLRKKS